MLNCCTCQYRDIENVYCFATKVELAPIYAGCGGLTFVGQSFFTANMFAHEFVTRIPSFLLLLSAIYRFCFD